MAMSKKKLTLSIVLCALLAGGVLGASLPAAIGTAQQTVKRLITDPGEGFAMPQEVRYDEERGTTVHALDPHPSYIFNPAGGSLKEDAQFEVWDIASQGEYAFEGMFRGSGRIYSGVAFTGKDSYTITISCDGTPEHWFSVRYLMHPTAALYKTGCSLSNAGKRIPSPSPDCPPTRRFT